MSTVPVDVTKNRNVIEGKFPSLVVFLAVNFRNFRKNRNVKAGNVKARNVKASDTVLSTVYSTDIQSV
mgnify:CR=1 FL=1